MSSIPLTKLKLNTTGVIKEINCKKSVKRRLLDLGLIPNTDITPIMKSVAGDPFAPKPYTVSVGNRTKPPDFMMFPAIFKS